VAAAVVAAVKRSALASLVSVIWAAAVVVAVVEQVAVEAHLERAV
jgi:hypothetical protein